MVGAIIGVVMFLIMLFSFSLCRVAHISDERVAVATAKYFKK